MRLLGPRGNSADVDCRRPVRHELRSYGRAMLLSYCSRFLRGTDGFAEAVVYLELPGFGVSAQGEQTPRRVNAQRGQTPRRVRAASGSTANITRDSLLQNVVLLVDQLSFHG